MNGVCKGLFCEKSEISLCARYSCPDIKGDGKHLWPLGWRLLVGNFGTRGWNRYYELNIRSDPSGSAPWDQFSVLFRNRHSAVSVLHDGQYENWSGNPLFQTVARVSRIKRGRRGAGSVLVEQHVSDCGYGDRACWNNRISKPPAGH